MDEWLIAYLVLAGWFWCADMLAAEIADSPSRPVWGFVLALIWPLSQAFALVACAAIITHLKKQIAEPKP